MKSRFMMITLAGFLIVLLTTRSEAQEPQKVHRIGFIVSSVSGNPARIEAFRQGLRELGYVEGKNILIEWREDAGSRERQRAFAEELARLMPAAIVTVSGAQALAVKNATRTIPVVMTTPADPVASGLVSSLARPGGNLTGLASGHPELNAKRLQLLKETIAKISRVAVFASLTGSTDAVLRVKEFEDAAGPLGLKIQPLDVRTAKDIDPSFQSARKERADEAFVQVRGPVLTPNRKQFATMAVQSRLPVLYESAEEVEAGGLMSYGVNIPELYRRAASYVDKILKGANPADLPIERPTKFELVVNQQAAGQISLTIPASVLARADRIIK